MNMMQETQEVAQAAYDNRHGMGYAILLFLEHSLGKTRFGSVMGLALAIAEGIFKWLARRLSKPKPEVPAENKESSDVSH